MSTTGVRNGNDTTTHADSGAKERRRRAARYVMPLLGVMVFLLTTAGLSGVGDAPAPHDSAASMSAYFPEVDDAVLASAPLGTLGAVALAAFVLALARRLHRRDETVAAVMVVTGGSPRWESSPMPTPTSSLRTCNSRRSAARSCCGDS